MSRLSSRVLPGQARDRRKKRRARAMERKGYVLHRSGLAWFKPGQAEPTNPKPEGVE